LELNEVLVRIFGRHKRLIVALLLAGALGGVAIHLGDPPRYAATARLVLDTTDPEDQAQSGVIADTTRAIATGPSLVRNALDRIGARRDAAEVARRHIDVQALGSSGIMQLSVTDTDPAVAVALANAVAEAVIASRLEVTSGQAATVVRDLDRQIAELQGRVDELSARAADPQVQRQRDVLVQRLSQIQTERANIEAARAERPKADVLDAASLPARQVPGRRLPDLVLGGMLGLLVGIGAAAAVESLRPTLVGRSAIARGVEAPVLAELAGPPSRRAHRHGWEPADVAEAAMHVELVAVAAGVQQVRLMALDRQLDLSNLVHSLGGSLKTATVQQAEMPTARRRRPGVKAGQEPDAPQNGDTRVGLVLVTPSVVKLAELDPVKDFLTISGWPLLGVIVYQAQRKRERSSRVDRGAWPQDDYSEVDA
jgi:hypothetical protein